MSPSSKNFDEPLKNVFYALTVPAETMMALPPFSMQTGFHGCRGKLREGS
jgi:hypothetical protein